jgi:hypothetical protein
MVARCPVCDAYVTNFRPAGESLMATQPATPKQADAGLLSVGYAVAVVDVEGY